MLNYDRNMRHFGRYAPTRDTACHAIVAGRYAIL